MGGDGKLILDDDLSALNPENLMILADVLDGEGNSSSLSDPQSSFADLAESTDISALMGDGSSTSIATNSATNSNRDSQRTKTSKKVNLHTAPLRINEIECFIFGFTTSESGEIEDLVMGSIVDDEPVYIGLFPSTKISQSHLRGISLEFFE